MLAWQTRARAVAVVVAAGVAAAVFVTTRRREVPPAPLPVPRVDPRAVVESSGAIVRQVTGEKENFRLDAEKQLSYSDGATKLLGVRVTLEREGRTYVVTGDEARVGDHESNIELTGNVHMTASDGLDVVAGSATYSEGEGIVRAPGPVVFRRGRMSGTGVDFTFDKNRDQIGLADKTAITFAPDEHGADATDITAGAALLDRKDKFANFEGAVHIVRSDQVIDANSALADLTEDEKHITGLELTGDARMTTRNAAPGGLRGMSGDLINLTYARDSEVLQRAVLAGTSELRLAGDLGSPERTLSANYIEIGLGPDGATVTSLNARDRLALELPAPKGQASKSIRSTTAVGSGDARRGLTTVTFTENAEYRESGGTPAVQRVVTSQTLETSLNNGLGEIRDAHFSGAVRFRDAGTTATAADARYQVSAGRVELTGSVGNAAPRVVNDDVEVEAERIEMTLAGPKLVATDSTRLVRTLLKASKPGAAGARATKMPGFMQQDNPLRGTSSGLAYDGDRSVMQLTGNAQLWQGDTRITGETIDVDGGTGNLSASGGVRSILLVQDTNAATKMRETSRAATSAQAMVYEDGTRTVTYTTDANLDGPQGNLKGSAIVLHLGANGQDIDRIEATGNVTFREQDRLTTGNRLIYAAAAGEYNVSGTTDKLVQMIRRAEDGCRESSGNLLTFSRATDSLRIEGKEVTRTQTRAVSCSGLPPVN